MLVYPTSTITLVGSSEKGIEDGKEMSWSIKNYLVYVYGINESRIIIGGRFKPLSTSEKRCGKDITSLRESDRRVTIESMYPEILSEYQNESNNNRIEIAPVESYVTFKLDNESVFTSWSLEIKDDMNNMQKFGPYTGNEANISTANILGTLSSGTYKVTMIGFLASGDIVKKESTVDVVLWEPVKNVNIMKYSVIFDFDSYFVSNSYEDYLINTIIPNIPINGLVILDGYTDEIGEEPYNMKLSLNRAKSVKNIIVDELTRLNRTDVNIQVNGLGETGSFNNTNPEGRFYNRSQKIITIYYVNFYNFNSISSGRFTTLVSKYVYSNGRKYQKNL